MYPEDLRGPFYFFTVWSMLVLMLLAFLLLPTGYGLFWLYFIAWGFMAVACMFTAGFGVAEFLQSRWDEKMLRWRIERELMG